MIIAIAKGRVFQESLALLEKAGIKISDDISNTRKLILNTNQSDLKIMIVRSFDIPTYVEYGAASLGIVGKDVLLEHPLGSDCLEMLDLKIANCRICFAAKLAFNLASYQGKRLKIATKYPKITRNYFTQNNLQVDIIPLYGSMELAPLVGLSDGIVDLVDTGNTLKANQLVEIDMIKTISSRLIVNSAHLKIDFNYYNHWIRLFSQAIN